MFYFFFTLIGHRFAIEFRSESIVRVVFSLIELYPEAGLSYLNYIHDLINFREHLPYHSLQVHKDGFEHLAAADY